VAAAAGLLWACAHFARGVAPGALVAALVSASLPLVALATALNLGQVYLRALYLKAMLAPVRVVGAGRLLRYSLAYYATNNLLPGRVGEVLRVYLLKTRESVPAEASVAVALVEKVFDAISLLLLALPLPLLLAGLPREVARATLLLGAGGLVGLGAAWTIARLGDRAGGRFARFARGAAVVRQPRPFAVALGLSLLTHLVDAVGIAICLAALHIEVPLAAPLLVLIAVAVALAVPSTPAGIGALEVGAVAALRVLGVDGARALAFALVYHAMQVIPVTLLGLEGLRLLTPARALAAGAASSES
jgi:uncharacterized membrane protein YbhN (UPF0104 family)